MVDFKNSTILKLGAAPGAFNTELSQILVEGEEIILTYRAFRDGVAFTNKRIFIINVKGLTGTKKDITSLPYSKIQAVSTESAGMFDLDGELDIWISPIGKIRLEFVRHINVFEICQIISKYML